MGQELTGAPLHLTRIRADLAKARAAAVATELNALESILQAREMVETAEAGQRRAGMHPALLASLHRAGDHTMDPEEEGITA